MALRRNEKKDDGGTSWWWLGLRGNSVDFYREFFVTKQYYLAAKLKIDGKLSKFVVQTLQYVSKILNF